jgi:hypothetical protein
MTPKKSRSMIIITENVREEDQGNDHPRKDVTPASDERGNPRLHRGAGEELKREDGGNNREHPGRPSLIKEEADGADEKQEETKAPEQ